MDAGRFVDITELGSNNRKENSMSDDVSNKRLHEDFKELKGEFKELKDEFKEFRRDMNNRFEKMDDRFEKMNDRFERMNDRIDAKSNRTLAVMLIAISLATAFVVGFPTYLTYTSNVVSASMKASAVEESQAAEQETSK